MTDATLVYGIFGAYLGGLLLIGILVYRSTDFIDLESYLLAGRKVGSWGTAFSEVATVASAFTFFGFVGIGYTLGVASFWYVFITVVFHYFVWRYIGPKMRRDSKADNTITVADHLGTHFEKSRPQIGGYVRLAAAFVTLFFLIAYVGSQLVSVGISAEDGLGVNYTMAVIVGGLIVGIYTTMGGFTASIWTDFVQGWLMLITAIAFPILVVMEAGGLMAFFQELQAVDPALTSWNAGLSGMDLYIFVLGWIAIGIGFIGQPHGIQRFQAARSERVISIASLIAIISEWIRMAFPAFIGMSGYVLFETVDDPEAIAVMGLFEIFPTWLAAFLLAGIVSALLSTTDSMLILASSDFVRNVYEEFINQDPSDRERLMVSRILIAGLALFAIVVGIIRPATVFDIVIFGFVGLGASLGTVLLTSFYWDKLNAWGALAGIITGFVMTVLNGTILLPEYDPMLVWPVTFGMIYVVTILTYQDPVERREDVGDEVTT